MNKIKIIAILIISISSFTSCNNDKKTSTNNAATTSSDNEDAGTSKATCNINGKLWAAKEFNCGISKKIGFVGITFYSPDGKNGQQLLLASLDYTKDYKVGGGIVYKKAALAGVNMNMAGFTITDEKRNVLKDYAITEGEVKLTTAKDDRAIGTFNFIAVDKEHGGETITVTDGKFDVEMNVEKEK